MKLKLTFILLLFFNSIGYAQNQSILDFFEIKEIRQIEITFSLDMEIDTTCNKLTKVSKDSLFLKTATDVLSTYPAGITWWKKFPSDINTWRMRITDEKKNTHDLIFFGTLLAGPDRSTSYTGTDEEKINLSADRQKLYQAMSKELFGR